MWRKKTKHTGNEVSNMNPEEHRVLAIITRRNASTRYQKWIDLGGQYILSPM
jgi:hypothetical protein